MSNETRVPIDGPTYAKPFRLKDSAAFCANSECGECLFVLNQDIYYNTKNCANQLYPDKGQGPWLGHEQTTCRSCGLAYYGRLNQGPYVWRLIWTDPEGKIIP